MDVSYSSLFARDMDFPIQSIYLSLDPVSLKNSRLVCTQWDEFIKRRVWGTPKGSQPNLRLRQRLDYHWIHATPAVKSVVLQLDMNGPFNALNPVQSLSCDDSVIVLGLTDDQAKVYDFVSLNHLVDLDCRPPTSYQPHPSPDIINFGNVYADVGRSVVATVTDKGDVSVWRKSDWTSVFKQSPHGNHAVTQVKVLPNLIITGGGDGKLTLLSWDGDQVVLMRMIEGEGIMELPFPVPHDLPLMNRICGLDSDGEWVLYGTMTRLNVWNLIDNTLAQSYDADLVRSVALNYPYAVVTGDGNNLMVWDLRTGQQVKKLGVNTAFAINHNKNILVGSDNTWGNPMRHRVNFFDLEQITNPNLKGPLWKRRKYLEDGNRAVKSCVNTSCLVTVQGDRLNVWDFWNCEEFNDNPDDFNDFDEFIDDPDEFSDSSDDYYDYSSGFSDGDGYSDNSGGFAENSDVEYPNGFGDYAEEYDEIGHNPDGFGNDDVEYNGNPDELNDNAEVYSDNSDEFSENGAECNDNPAIFDDNGDERNEYLDACGENEEEFSDNQDVLDIDADEFNENPDECGDNEEEFSDNPDELSEDVSDIPDDSGDNGEGCNDDSEECSDHPDDNSDNAEEFSDEEEYSEDSDEDYSEDADEDYSDDLDEDY